MKSEEELTRTNNSSKKLFEYKDELSTNGKEQLIMGSPVHGDGVEEGNNDLNRRLKHASESFIEEYKYSVIEEGTNGAEETSKSLTLILLALFNLTLALFR